MWYNILATQLNIIFDKDVYFFIVKKCILLFHMSLSDILKLCRSNEVMHFLCVASAAHFLLERRCEILSRFGKCCNYST